jgi:hypothetical protein
MRVEVMVVAVRRRDVRDPRARPGLGLLTGGAAPTFIRQMGVYHVTPCINLGEYLSGHTLDAMPSAAGVTVLTSSSLLFAQPREKEVCQRGYDHAAIR